MMCAQCKNCWYFDFEKEECAYPEDGAVVIFDGACSHYEALVPESWGEEDIYF